VIKALCKIGPATTNEQFRRWCLDPSGGNLKWTVPFNVIMLEITWGGSNATICHRAGLQNETLSDLVVAIEFVNARGQLQVISDPDQLRAASGAFGLLGIMTAITLKLGPMTFAKLRSLKKRLALAVPATSRKQVPRPAALSTFGRTGRRHGRAHGAGTPIIDDMSTEAYADRFPEFKRGLGAVAQAGGTTIKDMQRLFSNSLLDQVFSDVFD
jgi:hypothetical protein